MVERDKSRAGTWRDTGHPLKGNVPFVPRYNVRCPGPESPQGVARELPIGVYLFELIDGVLVVWRIGGDEPDDAALAAADLWPLLLPEPA